MVSDLGTGPGVFADVAALVIGGYAVALYMSDDPVWGTTAFLSALVIFGVGRLLRLLIGGT